MTVNSNLHASTVASLLHLSCMWALRNTPNLASHLNHEKTTSPVQNMFQTMVPMRYNNAVNLKTVSKDPARQEASGKTFMAKCEEAGLHMMTDMQRLNRQRLMSCRILHLCFPQCSPQMRLQ